jgi:hypothetical protein
MQNGKRWLKDFEVEQATGGAITAVFLRKDRAGLQVIPFHRIGAKMVRYDLDEIHRAIEAARVGGVKQKPAKHA